MGPGRLWEVRIRGQAEPEFSSPRKYEALAYAWAAARREWFEQGLPGRVVEYKADGMFHRQRDFDQRARLRHGRPGENETAGG